MKPTKTTVLLLSVALAIAALCVAGCAQQKDPTPEIKEVVTAQLDGFDPEDEEICDLVYDNMDDTAVLDEVESAGQDRNELIQTALTDFGYKITEVKAKGNEGTATFVVIHKNFDDLHDALEIASQENMDKLQSAYNSAKSKDDVTQVIMEYFMTVFDDAIDNIDTVESDPLTVNVVNNNGKWEVSDEDGLKQSIVDAIGFSEIDLEM